jgi:hypothetical protein
MCFTGASQQDVAHERGVGIVIEGDLSHGIVGHDEHFFSARELIGLLASMRRLSPSLAGPHRVTTATV